MWSPLLVTVKGDIVQSVPCTAAIVRTHLSSNHSWFIPQFSLVAAETPNSETGRNWARNGRWILPISISFVSQGIFITCRNFLRHRVDGFTVPPKELVLWIFIALRNTSPSAGFEPSNLGYNRMHANHCTTENEWSPLSLCIFKKMWRTGSHFSWIVMEEFTQMLPGAS
jgi:hypothetical protein